MLVHSEVIAIIFVSCLSHSVEILRELQFWAANVIWGKPLMQYAEGQNLLGTGGMLLLLFVLILVIILVLNEGIGSITGPVLG
jgi:hypothetical protein